MTSTTYLKQNNSHNNNNIINGLGKGGIELELSFWYGLDSTVKELLNILYQKHWIKKTPWDYIFVIIEYY